MTSVLGMMPLIQYVYSDIEPTLAKQVARGDACPITLLPMDDINPTFVPRVLKSIPLNVQDARKQDGGRATGSRKDAGKGTVRILSFFSKSDISQTDTVVTELTVVLRLACPI